mgnify:CR=1 FL=1
MQGTRRLTCVAIALAGTALFITSGLAHHGWDWAEGENFELTGVITAAQLGNPHGVLTVSALPMSTSSGA